MDPSKMQILLDKSKDLFPVENNVPLTIDSKFVGKKVALVPKEESPKSKEMRQLNEERERLKALRTPMGKKMKRQKLRAK